MRTFTLISILLLSILVHEAQGIRMVKGSLSGRISEVHENQNNPKRSNVGIEEPDLCKDTPCLESGMKRKLTTKTTSASSTTSPTIKKDKSGHGNSKAEEENLSVTSSTLNENPDNVPARYPDIIDIAGMDYSPARRKPPIHN